MLKEAGTPVILDNEAQRLEIREVTNPDRYLQFNAAHFYDSSGPYQKMFIDTIYELEGELPEDYFRFKATIGMLGAQFGFESMLGHLLRHVKNKWLGSPFSPSHELELGRYITSLNVESHPIKQGLSDEFYDNNLAASLGVWGVPLMVEHGHINERRDSLDIKAAALSRFSGRRPICLPTPGLNNGISRIALAGEDSEKGVEASRVEQLFGGLFDTREVFSHRVYEVFDGLPKFNPPLTQLLLPRPKLVKVA